MSLASSQPDGSGQPDETTAVLEATRVMWTHHRKRPHVPCPSKDVTMFSATRGRRWSIISRASAQEAQYAAWDIRRADRRRVKPPNKLSLACIMPKSLPSAFS